MKTIMTMIIMIFSTQVLAFEKEDSMNSLQAAMFESNKDYNTHKKVVLDQENDRIGNWNNSEALTVNIKASIEVEKRNYRMDAEELASEQAEKADFADFQEVKKELPAIQEVSMNN